MSRQRSRQPTISLFSFQDIITSVTAILILVVLILTLELISQKYSESASDNATVVSVVADSVAELEMLASRLAAETQDETARVVFALPTTTTDRELHILREQFDRVTAQVDSARRINDEARRLAEVAAQDLASQQTESDVSQDQERDADQLSAETLKMEAANAAERARLETRQDELDSRPSAETELVFKRPRNSALHSWLLEVSASGFSTLRLGTGQTTALGTNTSEGSEFTRWLAQLTPNKDYVLILARPSGVEAVNSARTLLDEKSIPYGMDFIGEEQDVHDGSAAEEESSPDPSSEGGPL